MRNWDCLITDAVDNRPNKGSIKKPNGKKPNGKKPCTQAKVETDNLVCCDSRYVYPKGTKVPLIKVPVVLTEEEVQVDVESHVKFDEPVSEVKRIKKNVFLDQCKVIVTKYHPFCSKGKLFISGYVRKNIEYTTNDCEYKNISSGKLKHLTVKVPFKCVTEITFRLAQPVLSWPIKQEQYEVLDESCNSKCNDTLTGKKECENILITKEDLMEPIYCEFEGAKLIEIDLHEGLDHRDGFKEMTEKMVAYIKLKVLQKQQVKGFDGRIPLMDNRGEDEEIYEEEDEI